MSDCTDLNAKLETIIANQQAANASKNDDFLQLVSQYKDEIVSILMTANTWDELNIEINLADYVKVQ